MNGAWYCLFSEERLGKTLAYVRMASLVGLGYLLGLFHGNGNITSSFSLGVHTLDHLVMLFLVALAVGNLVLVVSKMPIFDLIRKKIDLWDPNIGFAVKCTYCLMGWTTIPVLIFYYIYTGSHFFFGYTAFGINIIFPLDFIFSWLVVWSIEALYYERIWAFLLTVAPKKRIHRGDSPPFLNRVLAFIKGGT